MTKDQMDTYQKELSALSPEKLEERAMALRDKIVAESNFIARGELLDYYDLALIALLERSLFNSKDMFGKEELPN